ncbi:lysozyme [Gilliamella sp. CG16]|uniref:lysozyme n=1 Tax=Gilliamella sp. CG16 TaxID=3351503 RepID=UPI00398768FF
MKMNTRLKNKIIALTSAGAGTIAIATVLITNFEGVSYTPYRDVANVLTVCHGHTGPDIVADKKYTSDECAALLDNDLKKTAVHVDKLLTVDLPDTTRAALYSFAFNVGVGAFEKSTLLKKINSGDTVGACNELRRWVYAGGKKWLGLVNRRDVEEQICLLAVKQ